MNLVGLDKPKSKFVSAIILLAFCWANTAVAAQNQDTEKWQFDLTLYGWFTDIGGTVNHSGGVVPGGPFDIDVSNIIDNLSMVFMGGFSAHKNRWSIIADAIYLGIGNDKDTFITTRSGIPINANVDLDFSGWILTGGVGYDVVQTDRGTLAVIGGVRYAMVDVDATLSLLRLEAERSESEGLVDGIVGVRGFFALNEQWYVPYYADIGTGDSNLTWQALAGIGYRFGWGDIKLVYRYLSYDMDDDKLLKDLDLSGPALGVVFRF